MFLGTYEPNLLKNGKVARIALPKKIRAELKTSQMVLTIGVEPCINGFSATQWEEATRAVLAKPLFDDKEGRDQRRRIYSDAEVVELDVQGRFVLPQRLKEYAQIHKEVVIMGVGDHFEIWDKAKWGDYKRALNQ